MFLWGFLGFHVGVFGVSCGELWGFMWGVAPKKARNYGLRGGAKTRKKNKYTNIKQAN